MFRMLVGHDTRAPDGLRVTVKQNRAPQAVREEFLDAAFRAIAEHGPDVSMEDIARAAGSSKPRLYRHFADKDDLYLAVAQRMGDDVYQNIHPDFNFLLSPPRAALAAAVGSYARVVAEHPAVFRFLARGTAAPQQGDRSGYPLSIGRDLSKRVTVIAENVLGSVTVDSSGVETVVYAAVGAILAATDLWLQTNQAPTPDDTAEFVSTLTPLVWGLVDAFFQHRNLPISADEPIFVSLANIRAGT